MLFGIGGGVGFSYFLFEQSGTHPIHIGTRIHTKETERPEFFQSILSRIGASGQVQNSSSANAAAGNMRRNLEQGHTPVVWVDPQRLPYLAMSRGLSCYYCVVVFGHDESSDMVKVADRAPGPLSLPLEQFRTARETSWSPKYRAMVIEKGGETADLRASVQAGILDSIRQMNGGLGITNFGLRGMEKWAGVLTSAKEKKSWIKVLPPSGTLFEALYSVFCQITARGAGGSADRALYADFLTEASDVLNRPALREAAANYRELEQKWREVAEAHLPGDIPVFAEARELTLRRKRLFEEKGGEAADEMETIRKRLDEIIAQCHEQFPLSFGDSRALLNELQQRILNLRDAEAEAVRAIEAAMELSSVPSA